MKKILSIFMLAWVLAACTDKKTDQTTETKSTETKTTTATENKQVGFVNVKPEDFKKQMSSKAGLLLDVRTPAEVAKGKLPKATHLDFYKPDFDKQVEKLDKNQPVYVYCAVGGRSGKTMAKMKTMGFKEVYNLAGGFNAWKQLGYEIEK